VGDRVGELQAIYAHPDCWDTGIGSRLHEHVLEAVSELGFREATLWAERRLSRCATAALSGTPDRISVEKVCLICNEFPLDPVVLTRYHSNIRSNEE
jgi:GNAT superfamily N-acetyltransferase